MKKVLEQKEIILDVSKIEKTSHGKPFIKDLGFDYNISHTKGMIACVLGKNVGIDCQKIRQVKQSVIKKVCSEEEIDFLKNSKTAEKDFIVFWTFKEAYTKMLGSGFRYSFKNVCIENAFCLHNDIKIYQKLFGDIALTAVEETGDVTKITEL